MFNPTRHAVAKRRHTRIVGCVACKWNWNWKATAQLLKCSSAQVLKCSTAPLLKCSMTQLLSCSITQPLSCSAAQLLNRSAAQLLNRSAAQPLSCSAAQLLNDSAAQPLNCSTTQLLNCPRSIRRKGRNDLNRIARVYPKCEKCNNTQSQAKQCTISGVVREQKTTSRVCVLSCSIRKSTSAQCFSCLRVR